ncbi:MAG TPA: cysteine desulfurase [Pseudomonadota bacterium]|nr:cysteine desulfurase [Pseudomonadota bacterium]
MPPDVSRPLPAWAALRADFPGLRQTVHERPLVYLDNASTTQKPQQVLDALLSAYVEDCANIHRGVHTLSQRATSRYEAVRETVRRFLNAPRAEEVIFTRGTTEAINLLAHSLGHGRVERGDEVLISALEHHSNLVPWQRLCDERGASLRVLPLSLPVERMLQDLPAYLSPRTRIVALSQASNAIGTILPIAQAIAIVRHVAPGAVVVVDGAQAVPHMRVDVQALDCDFYAFSGHKLYGPTGVGVLWGRAALLAELPPWQSGGDMVLSVTLERTQLQAPPHKFEAGTPPIAEVIGLGAAIDYFCALDRPALFAHEAALRADAVDRLSQLPGVTILGGPANPQSHVPVVSFTVAGVHPHDLGTALDFAGIAVRSGHHCAQPLLAQLGVAATVRVSLGLYNTQAELETLATELATCLTLFRR